MFISYYFDLIPQEAEEHLALDIDTQLALILQQEALQAVCVCVCVFILSCLFTVHSSDMKCSQLIIPLQNDLTITNELTATGSDMPNSASAQQLIEKRVKEELALQRERVSLNISLLVATPCMYCT